MSLPDHEDPEQTQAILLDLLDPYVVSIVSFEEEDSIADNANFRFSRTFGFFSNSLRCCLPNRRCVADFKNSSLTGHWFGKV
jgi:hypothetical protein